jgi:hypothetical protein
MQLGCLRHAPFIPEGNHWVDARCAACGNETGKSCHRQENERYHGDSWEIVPTENSARNFQRNVTL